MNAKGYTIDEYKRIDTYAIEPKLYVDDVARTGFTEYAEKLNGRLAMIGFVSLIAMEVITGHGLVAWLTSL
ncbi:MAG: high light inducible protein [Nostocales cyanobacterium 94392]|nr:high light inducible protein [Nostocales cyanobacterium 94392]